MSETRGPAFNDVERLALATAAQAGLRPAEFSQTTMEPGEMTLMLQVLEARLSDIECRLEARLFALENDRAVSSSKR